MARKVEFQKRHFEFIAATLAGAAKDSDLDPAYRDQANKTAKAFADNLASTNPHFDRLRFLKACGVEL